MECRVVKLRLLEQEDIDADRLQDAVSLCDSHPYFYDTYSCGIIVSDTELEGSTASELSDILCDLSYLAKHSTDEVDLGTDDLEQYTDIIVDDPDDKDASISAKPYKSLYYNPDRNNYDYLRFTLKSDIDEIVFYALYID